MTHECQWRNNKRFIGEWKKIGLKVRKQEKHESLKCRLDFTSTITSSIWTSLLRLSFLSTDRVFHTLGQTFMACFVGSGLITGQLTLKNVACYKSASKISKVEVDPYFLKHSVLVTFYSVLVTLWCFASIFGVSRASENSWGLLRNQTI